MRKKQSSDKRKKSAKRSGRDFFLISRCTKKRLDSIVWMNSWIFIKTAQQLWFRFGNKFPIGLNLNTLETERQNTFAWLQQNCSPSSSHKHRHCLPVYPLLQCRSTLMAKYTRADYERVVPTRGGKKKKIASALFAPSIHACFVRPLTLSLFGHRDRSIFSLNYLHVHALIAS